MKNNAPQEQSKIPLTQNNFRKQLFGNYPN